MTRPQTTEAADYYFKYIDLITSDDIVPAIENQMGEMLQFLSGISEEQSLYAYAPGKWTIREVLNHVNDGERIFAGRALWFARGFNDAQSNRFAEKAAQLFTMARGQKWSMEKLSANLSALQDLVFKESLPTLPHPAFHSAENSIMDLVRPPVNTAPKPVAQPAPHAAPGQSGFVPPPPPTVPAVGSDGTIEMGGKRYRLTEVK